jgi:adenine/guanine phosphoribosyltransferase-like PRPP-binding protein
MDKFLDFPEHPRKMSDAEGEQYFDNMLQQISNFQPDEIIAVNRSGLSYAMWVAQELKLPLGCYWPKSKRFISDNTDSKRIVFVDDNVLQGSTYLETKQLMQAYLYEWKWAVLFSDWHTPEHIRNEIIQGTRLPYFAEEPIWGSRKISQNYGVRYRDE